MSRTGVVLFPCPHNAAKSLLAAAYFDRLAQQRGLPNRADSAGTEPEAAPAPAVVDALQAAGVDVSGHRPRSVKEQDLARAPRSFDGLRPDRGDISQRTNRAVG
jgi:protein-tyrosine-phosphatase